MPGEQFSPGGEGKSDLFPPLISHPCGRHCDWLVYADAATSHPRMCASRFKGGEGRPRAVHQLSSAVPTAWVYLFRSTFLIFGLELLDFVAFLGGIGGLPGMLLHMVLYG